MKKEGKELEVIEPSTPGTPASSMASVIQYGIKEQIGAEQLEKMMELQERYEANEARKAYHFAMAAFKANPPKINKDAHVNYKSQKTGQVTDYKHATLANVTDTINTSLSKQGLSSAWIQDQKDSGISVTCKITHIMGHSESTTLTAAPDTSGGKNSIQAVGSTVTYLQRYTLLSLTGLATHESDDDGQGSEAEYITEKQLATIDDFIDSLDVNIAKFKSYMSVDELEKILASDYKKAIIALKAKEKKK